MREAVGAPRAATQLHWGGGTPTHLRPDQIRRLFRAVDDAFPLAPGAEISLEVDPRVTTPAHIDALRECGFNRISLGVQDFDPGVQAAIHRTQSVEQTASLTDLARRSGFESVSFDLIYGLPLQTEESFDQTIDKVLALAPDRIALYGYAHVTWVAKQQRGFERVDLPDPTTRLAIFVRAVRRFVAGGYVQVGMDHFARPGDELAHAQQDGSLRRNFMGYTTQASVDLIGLGPTAISELREGYAQSHREFSTWESTVRRGALATMRGHRLEADDRARAWVIGRIMCLGEVNAAEFRAAFGKDFAVRFAPELTRLKGLAADGLVERATLADKGLRLTTLGWLLVRQVASVFDAHLPELRSGKAVFSSAV